MSNRPSLMIIDDPESPFSLTNRQREFMVNEGEELYGRFGVVHGKTYKHHIVERLTFSNLVSVLQKVKLTKTLAIGNPRGKSFDQMMNSR